MIWLTWRQHRLELLLMFALAIGLAAAMAVVTVQIQDGMAVVRSACNPPGPLCQAASMEFDGRFSTLNTIFDIALLALPGLAGIFVGAPLLAREYEQGTVRLIWTQGITRLRWFGIKFGLVLTLALLGSAVLAVAGARMFWIASLTGRWNSFDIQGPAFVAYVIFAIALGTALGGLIRHSVPAMAATLVVFISVRVAVFEWVRPNFLPPIEWDINKPMTDAGDTWNLGEKAVDLSGHPVSQQYLDQLVANAGSLPGSLGDYLRAHGVIELQIYQPESRFWIFQTFEAAVFVGLAALLIGLAIRSTRRA